MDKSEMKYLKELKILERHEDGSPSLLYSVSKMPMMTERENLVSQYKKELGDGRTLFLSRSVDRPEYPRRKNSIRMDMYKASVFHEDGDDLRVVEYSNMDLGGYFPAKLLNMIMANMMSKGMITFYKKLKVL
jgi:hypothetical protein